MWAVAISRRWDRRLMSTYYEPAPIDRNRELGSCCQGPLSFPRIQISQTNILQSKQVFDSLFPLLFIIWFHLTLETFNVT